MAAGERGTLARAVIGTCLSMERSGINQGTSGNVSVRCGDGMLITPSGVPYERMTPDAIVDVDETGGWSGAWRPSSEWRMHRDIYHARPEAGAVVHAHPRNCTALACLGRSIPSFHYMVAVAGGPDIRCARYATFGTEALSAAMLDALSERHACLLANHGMICFGADLERALALAIEVEALAAQYLKALQVGEPVLLTEAEMATVLEKFRTYGAQPSAKDSQ